MSATSPSQGGPAPQAPEHVAPRSRVPWWRLAGLFVVSRLYLLAVAAISLRHAPKPDGFQAPASILDWFKRWDVLWYLDIAQHGYRLPEPGAQPNYGFFPLFPWLVRVASLDGLIDHRVAGYLVSLAALAGACVVLWRLVAWEWEDERLATWAVAFLLFGPVSFFFSTIYSEACFLAFSLGSVAAARCGRWWLAGVLGALAASTRLLGVLLIIPLLWEVIFREAQTGERQHARRSRSTRWNATSGRVFGTPFLGSDAGRPLLPSAPHWPTFPQLAACALPVLGVVLCCTVMYLKFGDPFLYFDAQNNSWGRKFAWFYDLFGRRSFTGLAPFYQAWFGTTVIVTFALLLYGAVRRIPLSYTLYALALIFMYISARFSESLPRYFSTVFPLYFSLALFARRWPRWGAVLLATSAALLAVSVTLFVNGYWFT